MTEEVQEVLLVPEDGFSPADFPRVTVSAISYVTSTAVRPDPVMTVTGEGVMHIDLGSVRLSLPDANEWNKMVLMGTALWNTHHQRLLAQQEEQRKEEEPALQEIGE